MKVPTTGNFKINGGDSAFINRQKELFDHLSQAEKECNKDQTKIIKLNDLESKTFCRPPPPGKRRKSETRQFRGKESIFKQPALPSPFADRPIPDHHRNPHKWKRYSLDDVQSSDMSDKTNTISALSFLNKLKQQKSKNKHDTESKMEIDRANKYSIASSSSSSSGSAVLYEKPSNKQKNNQSFEITTNDNEKIMYRGSKIILPEYVVGQKPINKSKKEKVKIQNVDRRKQLKLNHLEEFDDDN